MMKILRNFYQLIFLNEFRKKHVLNFYQSSNMLLIN